MFYSFALASLKVEESSDSTNSRDCFGLLFFLYPSPLLPLCSKSFPCAVRVHVDFIASDERVALGVGSEMVCKGREMGEGLREGSAEVGKERV